MHPKRRGGRPLSQEQFITAALARHGDVYDYSETVYTTAQDKINIICPIHGLFSQRAYAHLKYGCKKCGNERSGKKRCSSLTDFLTRAGEIHHYKYDYHLVAFNCQHQKIAIICPIHGQFQQPVNDHLKGHGCAKCGAEAISLKQCGVLGYSTEGFVARAIGVHGTLYEYHRTVYCGSLEPVTIICKVHGEFHQGAYHHLKGNGCLKCKVAAQTQSAKGFRGKSLMRFDEFQRRTSEIHGEKYSYKYFTKLTDKVGIECPEHGLFMQVGTDHLYSQAGCPACARETIREQLRYNRSEFEIMLSEKWEDRISLVGDYHDLVTLTDFNCFAHGHFSSSPNRVLSLKHGCPSCWTAIRGLLIRYTQSEYEIRASKVHLGKYQYGIYRGTDHGIEIECPSHGVFVQNSGNHLAGYGCPSCGMHKTVMQNQWLDHMGIKLREVWLMLDDGSRIKADGYVPETKTAYEFWGDYWHGNPRLYQADDSNQATGTTYGHLYQKTLNKRKRIVEQGFNLIEIWEQDWKRINGKAT